MTVLTVDHLKKLYRNQRGVREASFALESGDVFGLLGANGSGKTTAMKAICGMCQYEGDIRVFDVPLRDNTQNALRRVGCLVEAPAFYGYMSGRRNLELAALYYGIPDRRARAARALETVGLGRYGDDLAERYSLGMKARLGLALAILSEPDLMVLDEPLNGLDIEGMVDVRNTILRLARERGATFLISSHLAAEIEKACSRVGVMYEGELLATAAVPDLLESHGSVEAYYLDVLGRARAREAGGRPAGGAGGMGSGGAGGLDSGAAGGAGGQPPAADDRARVAAAAAGAGHAGEGGHAGFGAPLGEGAPVNERGPVT